jgi:ubiquinone/menaquinone biosynthesis C-methylase UbiE
MNSSKDTQTEYMDAYTRETKEWLDNRYLWVDENNVYIAHEPIYGMRNGHCEPAVLFRYMIAYRILRSLSHIQFESLLDVGGGEGYKAALIKRIYGVDVKSCDISSEACKRASEIFKISSNVTDIHSLSFPNQSFDVVLCSETLEHVTNWKKALHELLRISRKAVILTLPHESKQIVRMNRKKHILAGHINHFTNSSFDFVKNNQNHIKIEKIYSSLLINACILIETTYGPYYHYRQHSRNPARKFLCSIFNLLLPVFRNIFSERIASRVILLDDLLAKAFRTIHYSGMIVVILKDSKYYSEKSWRDIIPDQVIDFSVPYHHLN